MARSSSPLAGKTTMVTEPGQEVSPTSSTPLTFSETLNYYFAMEDALCEEKVRDARSGMVHLLQRVVDDLRYELTKRADAQGLGGYFRSAVREEQTAATRTVWIRTTASELKDTRLAALLLVTLLLGWAAFLIAYDILDMDVSSALLSELGIISLGFCLPWFMDSIATHEERKLRELRRIEDYPRADWWTQGSAILHIT
jgi:hypothetical protein